MSNIRTVPITVRLQLMNDEVAGAKRQNDISPQDALLIGDKMSKLWHAIKREPFVVDGYAGNDRLSIPPVMEYAVLHFMQLANRKVCQFDANQIGFYIGCMLEEMAEMFSLLQVAAVDDGQIRTYAYLAETLQREGSKFKLGQHYGDVMRANHVSMLDCFIDSSWVAQGGAMSLSHDPIGAFIEVARSNMSKLQGGVTFNAEHKIVKGPNYSAPQLAQFVKSPDRD
jgi:predicted HAD superfamily Cof-like phosphohydrolase